MKIEREGPVVPSYSYEGIEEFDFKFIILIP